ncbi:hypothetical protein AMTR_s00001p00270300 [Amborella trichopoda]|uniref:Uncharacterized protein n=1 Tax=Amborella trichopoda TaxID=13333 RepID=W1NM22_AMBTC|nr:hypothetical protein AMTR_s00001p00270300 [Amborella trichopoda]
MKTKLWMDLKIGHMKRIPIIEGVLEGKEIGTGGVIVISTGSGIMTVIGTTIVTVVEEEKKMERKRERDRYHRDRFGSVVMYVHRSHQATRPLCLLMITTCS